MTLRKRKVNDMKSIIFNIENIRRVQWNDLPNPEIISVRHVNGVWHIQPLAGNDNSKDCEYMPKETEDDRTLLFEVMGEYKDLRAQVARWASIMQSMGYMDLAGQMDALSDYGDVVHADVLMRMQVKDAAGVPLDISHWFVNPEPDSYA